MPCDCCDEEEEDSLECTKERGMLLELWGLLNSKAERFIEGNGAKEGLFIGPIEKNIEEKLGRPEEGFLTIRAGLLLLPLREEEEEEGGGVSVEKVERDEREEGEGKAEAEGSIGGAVDVGSMFGS